MNKLNLFMLPLCFIFVGCGRQDESIAKKSAKEFVSQHINDSELLDYKFKWHSDILECEIRPSTKWLRKNTKAKLNFPLFLEVDKKGKIISYL